MGTGFGILLFVLVYGRVAYLVFDDVTGGQPRVRPWLARSLGRREANPVQLRSP